MKVQLVTIFTFLLFQCSYSQDGYWDKDRATTKEIILGAGDRTVVKSEDLPAGTTEIVYRITMLDDNQQMANSLVSILKAIPDPTGISQGSAGAVFLLSKISGNDKCTYAVFSSRDAAKKYGEGDKVENACYLQNTAVNKDAKLLSAKSACISDSMSALWFGFESDNWIMKQKIILEIVPWVDRKANRGWTTENRKSIVNLCKSSELGRRMLNGDDFCVCVLDKIQQKYKFAEYQKLLSSEKIKAFSDFGNYCLTDKTANKTILNSLRADAGQHIKDGRYDDAIRLLQGGIIENGNATAADHYLLGKLYLLTKQPVKALKTLKQGEKLDDSELLVQVTLAHAYLLNDEYQEAKEIHKKYRNQNVTTSQSWIQRTKEDFAEFKRVGIQHPDFERLLKLLDVQ